MNARARRTAACVIAAAAVLACAIPSSAAPSSAARDGARYIVARQVPSGAFFSATATADGVAEALVALAVAGIDDPSIDRALAFMRANGPARADERAAYAGRIVAGLVATGQDPRAFGGVDYVSKIKARYDPVTGRYDNGIYSDALAMLGVLAAGAVVPDQALTFLRANQCSDGGFGHEQACAGGADVDTTAIVVCVLVAAGVDADDPARTRARAWLAEVQNADGGFGAAGGKPTNGNSTGLALSALAAMKETPAAWARARTPTAALERLQTSDGGFRYLATDPEPDDYATVQAVPGVAGRALPFRPSARSDVRRKPTAAASSAARASSSARPTGSRAVAASTPKAPSDSRAAVVVQANDGATQRFCVDFREPTISGYELLRRTGAPLVVKESGAGAFICKIGSVGRDHPRESCEPPCPDANSCTYWGYYRLDPAKSTWRFNERGASDTVVRDGTVEAWRFGTHSLSGGNPPEETTLEEICAAPVAAVKPKAGAAAGARAPMLFALVLAMVGGGAVVFARRARARETS